MNVSQLPSVVDNLRMADGALFPIPITLDVSRDDVERLSITPEARIVLRDPRDGEALAIITGLSNTQLNIPSSADFLLSSRRYLHPGSSEGGDQRLWCRRPCSPCCLLSAQQGERPVYRWESSSHPSTHAFRLRCTTM